MLIRAKKPPCEHAQASAAPAASSKSLFHFYEKVIKVKADVAALHVFFSDIDDAASGGVESCQGRRF